MGPFRYLPQLTAVHATFLHVLRLRKECGKLKKNSGGKKRDNITYRNFDVSLRYLHRRGEVTRTDTSSCLDLDQDLAQNRLRESGQARMSRTFPMHLGRYILCDHTPGTSRHSGSRPRTKDWQTNLPFRPVDSIRDNCLSVACGSGMKARCRRLCSSFTGRCCRQGPTPAVPRMCKTARGRLLLLLFHR